MFSKSNRRLWHFNSYKVERKRYFEPISMTAALAALTAAGGTAGVGYGLGNMFELFGGGKNNSNSDGQFNSYVDPRYSALYDKLLGIADTGYPEYQQLASQQFNQQLDPLREQYETKRNPYGGAWSDTPEYAQAAKMSGQMATDVASQNMQARLNALQMLSGLVQKPITTYEQPYDPMQEILAGGLGLGSSLLGNYLGSKWQSQALKDVMGGLGGQKGTSLYENPYANYFHDNTQTVVGQL